MNDLRLFLLVIGIGVIILIYLWGTLQSRKIKRQQTIRQHSPVDDIAGLKIASQNQPDIDYSSVLAGLSESISRAKMEQAGTEYAVEVMEAGNTRKRQKRSSEVEEERETAGLFTEQGAANKPVSGRTGEQVRHADRFIVTLHVIPRGSEVFTGQAILDAVEQLDLQMGEMDIFHHYGVGEMKMEKPLFSLANMIEPGKFDVTNMDTFTTPGLVMFMCLPSLLDGQVVFELMLLTCQRLADLLGAELCDENRAPITEQKIQSIRTKITAGV